MAPIHHLFDESRVNTAFVSPDSPYGRSQILQEGIHVGSGRTAVDANADAFEVKLPGVACSAGKSEVVFALIAVFHEPDWQCIRVAQGGLLRQVAVIIQGVVGTEKLGRAWLLQRHEEIVR